MTRGVVAVAAVLVLVAGGCSVGESGDDGGDDRGASPPSPVTIRMSWHTPGQEALYVMQVHPEVAPNLGSGVYRVEWTQGGGGQASRNLASGVVDGGALASLSAARAIDQGADLVVVGTLIEERDPNRPMTWLVRADAGIVSPADLAGQVVGSVGAGGFADLVGDHVIRSLGGLEPGQDYEKTQVPFPQMMDALLAGQIATGPFPPPFLQQTLATGEAQELFSVRDATDRLVATVLAFRREFVDANQEAVAAFMADWVTVHQWVADPANEEAVIEATSQVTEVPVDALDGYLLTLEDGYRPANGALDPEALQATWDFFDQQGAFSDELNVTDYVIEDLLPPPE